MTTLDEQFHIDDRTRPHSIDLSLELEHQLNSESLPSSPAAPGRPQSMDQNVLSSIVLQLRQSLAVATRERDELMDAVERLEKEKGGAAGHQQPFGGENELKEALQTMTERCTSLQEELEVARQKIKDDEDAISMLRSKVEESRRGLMRLQTENRRMTAPGGASPLSLDLSRANSMSSRDKRASFTPLTGSLLQNGGGHRRISSVSDSGIGGYTGLHVPGEPTTPGSQMTFAEHSPRMANYPPSSSHRFSGLFRGSPPLESQDQSLMEQIETLKRELKLTKDELEETRHELSEANEAREASETCVTALRSFIDENNIGAQQASNPVPPPLVKRQDSKTSGSGSGWGFKLWKADANSKAAAAASPPVATPPTTSSAPLAKLGGFFTSRGSISSTHSQPSVVPSQQQLDSMFNGSDTSSIVDSVVEPASPSSEMQQNNARVRGSGSVSDLSESPQGVKTFENRHSRERSMEVGMTIAL